MQRHARRARGRATLPRNVKRWRQRRKTIRATINASADDGDRPARARCGRCPVKTSVSHAVRSWAMARRIAVSTWSVTRRAPGDDARRTMIQTSERRPSTTSQPLAGGADAAGQRRRRADGRRRRPASAGRSAAPAAPAGRRRRRDGRRRPEPCVGRRRSRQALLSQPLGGDGPRACRAPTPRVRAGAARRSSAGPRRRRAVSTSVVPPAVDDLVAHERGDVLGRLQPAVVRQLDQVVGGDGGVGGEQQRRRRRRRPAAPDGCAGPPASRASTCPNLSP